MRTVSALGRALQRRRPAVVPVAAVRPIAGDRLISDALGEQHRGGARLDQVDGTTCGSAVLLALSTWADPTALASLDAAPRFLAAYDERQRQIHRETNRLWPRALGTTPWGFLRWLHTHVPGAGRYGIRFVDDTASADLDLVVRQVEAALGARRPVPLLVGTLVPRHYCLALRIADDGTWRVYEPTSGQVRALDPLTDLRQILGFDRLHAVFLPR
jgi:hypothetical protein